MDVSPDAPSQALLLVAGERSGVETRECRLFLFLKSKKAPSFVRCGVRASRPACRTTGLVCVARRKIGAAVHGEPLLLKWTTGTREPKNRSRERQGLKRLMGHHGTLEQSVLGQPSAQGHAWNEEGDGCDAFKKPLHLFLFERKHPRAKAQQGCCTFPAQACSVSTSRPLRL
jgi:hypothetical protein